MAGQNYTPPQVNINGDSVRQRLFWPITASSSMMSVGTGTNAAISVNLQADATTVPFVDGIPNVMAGVTGATSISDPSPNIIGQVWWSYNGSTSTGNLTIQGATSGTVFNQDVANANYVPFIPPLAFTPGEAVTITLGALANATGKVGVIAWKLK